MFDALATAIEELDVGVDDRELEALAVLRDRLDAKLTVALVAFDEAELWDTDGSVSMAAWLRVHAGMTQRDACRMSATARNDYGRATHTIPPALYTSLLLRDLGCRFPGCDRPGEWCEGHHVVHWEDGGPTCLSNLALLCSRHHHLLHLPGWRVKLLPSGTVEVTAPDGTVRTGDPPLRC